ncbi:MAG: phosphotransferase [Chloroflexota bacterium]
MPDLTKIHHLIRQEYGLDAITVSPLQLHDVAGRGIYKVDIDEDKQYLLRAYQQPRETLTRLLNSAETLLFLEKVGYPAPRVRRTTEGALLGYCSGWSGLLLTYIPGAMSTGTVAECRQIGEKLAELHNVQIDGTAILYSAPLENQSVEVGIPHCRWQPKDRVTQWKGRLDEAAELVPDELTELLEFSLDILSQVMAWSEMPMALLHADPNPFNAICTPQNEMIFIDWDGSGLGPAILDLGYLLLTTHAVLPEWPRIEPNRVLIEAIMQGYSSVRPLNKMEKQVLPIATCFNDAVWAAQNIPQVTGPGTQDWRENRTLNRFGARYPVLRTIGESALTSL